MRNESELRNAMRHLKEARTGALAAAAPLKEMEGAARLREMRQDENRFNAEIFGRLLDMCTWMLGQPAEFAAWMDQWSKMDRIQGGFTQGYQEKFLRRG